MRKFWWLIVLVGGGVVCDGLQLLSPSRTTKSWVEFTESETDCKVVLLGCLHGSRSSEEDVEELLQDPTDVLVLELCADRFASLSRTRQTPSPRKFLDFVINTKETRGWRTAVAVALFGCISGLQSGLSGFQPGLEFATATELCREQQQDCNIVLADQPVDETMQHVGNVVQVSLSMLRETLTTNNIPHVKEAKHLHRAVFGDGRVDPQVNMPSVMTRNRMALDDMVREFLPILVVTQLYIWAVQYFDSIISVWDPSSTLNSGSVFPDVTTAAALITGSYVLFALPAARVILRERDSFLARGVRKACQIAKEKRQGNNKPEQPRVVAVLGLLHVNGVTKALLESESKQQ